MTTNEDDQALVPHVEALPERRAPATLVELIGDLARDPTINVANLQALLAARERLEVIEAKANYDSAMGRVQAQLPVITKDGRIDMGTKGSMKFATFSHIIQVIGPILRKEGFSVSFFSEATPAGILLKCALSHLEPGFKVSHTESSQMALPADTGAGRNALQAVGSSLSYAKRYLLSGLLNLVVSGEDNDGSTAFPINEQQLNDLEGMLDVLHATAYDRSRFNGFMKVKRLAEIQAADYMKARSALQLKMKERGIE